MEKKLFWISIFSKKKLTNGAKKTVSDNHFVSQYPQCKSLEKVTMFLTLHLIITCSPSPKIFAAFFLLLGFTEKKFL